MESGAENLKPKKKSSTRTGEKKKKTMKLKGTHKTLTVVIAERCLAVLSRFSTTHL